MYLLLRIRDRAGDVVYFVTTDLRLGYLLKEYTVGFREKRFLWYECVLDNLLNEQGRDTGFFLGYLMLNHFVSFWGSSIP